MQPREGGPGARWSCCSPSRHPVVGTGLSCSSSERMSGSCWWAGAGLAGTGGLRQREQTVVSSAVSASSSPSSNALRGRHRAGPTDTAHRTAGPAFTAPPPHGHRPEVVMAQTRLAPLWPQPQRSEVLPGALVVGLLVRAVPVRAHTRNQPMTHQ